MESSNSLFFLRGLGRRLGLRSHSRLAGAFGEARVGGGSSFGKGGFASLMALLGLFCVFVALGLVYGRVQPKKLASEIGENATSSVRFVRFYRYGNMQMAVAPLNMSQKNGPMMFSVALNDPDAVLRHRNWMRMTQLSDNNGANWQPVSSNETDEGIVLAFNVTNSPPALKLTLQGVEEFLWNEER